MKKFAFPPKIIKAGEKRFGLKTSAVFSTFLFIFFFILGGCSAPNPTTKGVEDTEIEAVTEMLSIEEIRLQDLQANGEFFMMGHNESGHGIIYYLYCNASEYHRAEKDQYYLLRYETDLLTEAFWNSGSVAVRSGQKGEINGADWNILWMRFYTLRESEKTRSEEAWKQGESVGVWGTGCKKPIVFKLTECGDNYRTVTGYKDMGLLSLLRAEYEILGTKKQLITGVVPSGK